MYVYMHMCINMYMYIDAHKEHIEYIEHIERG